jgi:hypothetical protein
LHKSREKCDPATQLRKGKENTLLNGSFSKEKPKEPNNGNSSFNRDHLIFENGKYN